jgi:excinuclease ABC subunit B
VAKQQKVLVTTLTKRMAEDLSTYLGNAGIQVRYLHSDIDSIERIKIIRGLRTGEFDVLVGINLLREGLDLPEVSLVAILDADKTGFLRSTRSLIQTSGRAARHVDGKVVFYADDITDAIKETVDITNYRREKQIKYNTDNNITPQTILKSLAQIELATAVAEGYDSFEKEKESPKERKAEFMQYLELDNKDKIIELLRKEMRKAAQNLQFEKAAELRDRILELESVS